MEIRIESLLAGAGRAAGTVVVIDVFRAFTVAAVAFAKGAREIVMVGDLAQAAALKAAGRGTLLMGERGGARPEGFDFANSPAALAVADLQDQVLIQTTSNGTAGLVAVGDAEAIYAGALVNAEATVAALLRRAPPLVTLVAMGRQGAIERADEDELCALYLRSRLSGRNPDKSALRDLLTSLAPPPEPALVASGDYDLRDREIALEIDRAPFAVRVRREQGLLVARPEWPD